MAKATTKKTTATEDAVLVEVLVRQRLDHDGEAYDDGDLVTMDKEQAIALKNLGVVELRDSEPAPAA